MKAFSYLRVSTDRQELSPDVQRSQITACCVLKGYELAEVFDDTGVSGGVKFAERPKGAELLGRIAEVDAIIFAKLDRAFRDTVDCLLTVESLHENGKVVHFIDMGIDTSTPAGEMCMTFMVGAARFERRRIGERIRESLAAASKRPGWRQGPAGYGYRNVATVVNGKKVDGGRQAAVEAEAATLAMIKRLRSEKKPLSAIADALTAAQVPTRRGGRWQKETVASILRRME